MTARSSSASNLGSLLPEGVPTIVAVVFAMALNDAIIKYSSSGLAALHPRGIGAGVYGIRHSAPAAERGATLLDARCYLTEVPHFIWAPGLVILTAILAISLAGDRLRDRFPYDEVRTS